MKASFNNEEKFVLAIILKAIIEQNEELVLTNNSERYRLKVAVEARDYVQSELFEMDCRLAGVSEKFMRRMTPLRAQQIYSMLFPARGRRRSDYKFPEVQND